VNLFYSSYSKNDQENLQAPIKEKWAKEGLFHFHPSTEDDKFVFVHQTPHQQRMLQKYGNELCCLDATHKTTKYALFMFFIVVKTNVDYQVSLK
jgi:hypothetical protein